METFQASVQYNDLKGSSAADRADMTDASKWLRDKGHINDDEYVIGISMWAGENHGKHENPVYVHFLVADLRGHDNIPEMIKASQKPMHVKKIEIDMNIVDFMALFKRLEITLSNGGLLEGVNFTSD